ncbi:hypothetical protein A7L55_19535 [Acinetobacter baumannii]|nr:hypothetical protein A7L55_19535 [Acinetobacter baumannii]
MRQCQGLGRVTPAAPVGGVSEGIQQQHGAIVVRLEGKQGARDGDGNVQGEAVDAGGGDGDRVSR